MATGNNCRGNDRSSGNTETNQRVRKTVKQPFLSPLSAIRYRSTETISRVRIESTHGAWSAHPSWRQSLAIAGSGRNFQFASPWKTREARTRVQISTSVQSERKSFHQLWVALSLSAAFSLWNHNNNKKWPPNDWGGNTNKIDRLASGRWLTHQSFDAHLYINCVVSGGVGGTDSAVTFLLVALPVLLACGPWAAERRSIEPTFNKSRTDPPTAHWPALRCVGIPAVAQREGKRRRHQSSHLTVARPMSEGGQRKNKRFETARRLRFATDLSNAFIFCRKSCPQSTTRDQDFPELNRKADQTWTGHRAFQQLNHRRISYGRKTSDTERVWERG